jgi:hypothetical protein
MKTTDMRAMDYLEWLKDQEEYCLYRIEFCESPADQVDLGEELCLIREIKGIVQEWGDQDDKH